MPNRYALTRAQRLLLRAMIELDSRQPGCQFPLETIALAYANTGGSPRKIRAGIRRLHSQGLINGTAGKYGPTRSGRALLPGRWEPLG